MSPGVVNALVTSVIFAASWLWAAEWAMNHDFCLLNRPGLPVLAHAAGAVLLMDAWINSTGG